jgi:hypothetical protein
MVGRWRQQNGGVEDEDDSGEGGMENWTIRNGCDFARGVIGTFLMEVIEKGAWRGESGCGGELVGK